MTWLNAALAFAVTMLIMSMVTSVFVETLHRCGGVREKGLRLMLGHFFDRVIAPHLAKSGRPPEAVRTGFLDMMTVNRGLPGVAGKAGADVAADGTAQDGSLLSHIWSGRRLSRLEVSEFMARLGASEFGDALRGSAGAAGDAVLRDIAQTFDAFGREASVFFGRRARLVSVLVALAVAWFACVNPYDLMRTYLADPQVTARVLEMRERAIAEHEAKAGTAETETAREAALAQARAAVESLRQSGVPIGWTPERLQAAGFATVEALGVPVPYPVAWNVAAIFWLLAGGLLIGLGGPFWFDAVKSLTALRASLGGATPEAPPAGPPVTPAERFRIAQAGRQAARRQPDITSATQPQD